MPWSKALSRDGDQNTFIGLQCSRSRGGCYYSGLTLFPRVLGKTVISGISFRFVFKTQHNALETNKGNQNLTAQFLPCSERKDKGGDNFFPSFFPFPSPVLPRNAFVASSKASIRPGSLRSGWRVQEGKGAGSPAGGYSWVSQSARHRGRTGWRDRRPVSSKEGKRKEGNQRGRNGWHVSWYQPALQHPKA